MDARRAPLARVVVIAAWLVILGFGAWSATLLPPLLANSLAVPGTDSERARTILRERLREPDDGVFTVVFPGRSSPTAAEASACAARLAAVARAVPTGRPGESRDGGTVFADIQTSLSLPDAKTHTDDLRDALRTQGGRAHSSRDSQRSSDDLDGFRVGPPSRRGDRDRSGANHAAARRLGLTPAVVVPFVVAACTIAATLIAVFSSRTSSRWLRT